MTIIHKTGDLLETDCDVIAHGCNCFHTMGAGVAKALAQKWPQVLAADKESSYGDLTKLGTFTCAELYESRPWPKRSPRRIFNLYTQFGYGVGCHLDYDALRRALLAMKEATWVIARRGDDWTFANCPIAMSRTIAMPRIDCGLAGGDWERVEPIIQSVFLDRDIVVYSLEGP